MIGQSPELEMRPPYLRFERMESEDRAATTEKGHYVPKFTDMVHVTRPGQRETLVKEVEAFLRDSFDAARQGRIPLTWASHYKQQYEQWKAGVEAVVDGTPIKGWGQISNGNQEALIRAGVLTVEDLAQFPDEEFSRIGMGAAALKQKAIAFLAASKSIGVVTERMAAMETETKRLQSLVEEQAAVIKQLRAAVPASAASKIAEAMQK